MTKSGFALFRRRSICSRSRKSCSLLLEANTFSQPAAFSFATTCCPRNPPPPVTRTVLSPQKPISLPKHSSRSRLQVIGHAVIPLMPCATLFAQNCCALARRPKSQRLHASIHHDTHHLTNTEFRFPAHSSLHLLPVVAQSGAFVRPLEQMINRKV